MLIPSLYRILHQFLFIMLCWQPKDVKHTVSSVVIQKAVGEDWTKAVAGMHSLDEQLSLIHI